MSQGNGCGDSQHQFRHFRLGGPPRGVLVLKTICYDLDMDNISRFIKANPKYTKLQTPLKAARVCEVARAVGKDYFEVISFKDGVLKLATTSSVHSADIKAHQRQIITDINTKLGEELVQELRTKIQ